MGLSFLHIVRNRKGSTVVHRLRSLKHEADVRLPAGLEPDPFIPASDAEAGRFVTWRAMGIACALMPLLAIWVVQAELIWYTGHSTAISLFFHVTTPVFLIALLNLAVRKRYPQAALSPGEILTIYVMLSVAGTLCSHDLLQVIIMSISHPAYAANPQNRWAELLLPHVPSWSIVTDKTATTGFAVGNASLYRWDILKAWAKPLAFWSVFLLTLMAGLTCMMSIFRQPWTEKERLSFPVIQIPLMIATRLSELLRNRLFWIAFGIDAAIDLLNGFTFLYPAIPQVPIVNAFKFSDYFVERPWSAIGYTTVSLYPFVIGLAFFLPTDLAFSCWFFFLIFKAQMVISDAIGIQEIQGFPFPNEQAAGGYIAMGMLAVWLARRHLLGVWRTLLGREGGLDESREPMRYRTAVLGLLGSYVLLVLFGMALGASAGVMVVFFLLFFFYSLAIARMRAELGPPAHDLHAIGPEVLITNAVGTSSLSKDNLGVFSLFFGFNRAYRAHFAPHCIEGFKIAQHVKLSARSMLVAIAVALVVGLVSAVWALLHLVYVHGYSGHVAGQAFATEAWWRMDNWINFPKPMQGAATAATVGGALFALFLGAMRARFTWWLWHPVGYATCSSWSMGRLWACIFVAWVAKALITRYGGAKAYQKALPFFVGLTLGEFVVGSLWGIFGAIMKRPVYHFWG